MASMCTDQYCIRLLGGINVYRSVLYQASSIKEPGWKTLSLSPISLLSPLSLSHRRSPLNALHLLNLNLPIIFRHAQYIVPVCQSMPSRYEWEWHESLAC